MFLCVAGVCVCVCVCITTPHRPYLSLVLALSIGGLGAKLVPIQLSGSAVVLGVCFLRCAPMLTEEDSLEQETTNLINRIPGAGRKLISNS